MDKTKYAKMSELVGSTFTVEKAYGYTWKKYDPDAKRMLTSDTYEHGFKKVYTLETNRGKLDVGQGQLSLLLEAVYRGGSANINGRTFEVKSNGKTGMDIRYFFNAVKEAHMVSDVVEGEPIDLGSIPS